MIGLRGSGRVLRIGHRGAAAVAPENTIRSFERAVELGVDFIEFDVLDLAGGELVLAHSDDLREVSHGAAGGRVRPLSLAMLRAVAPGLPTLEDALAFFAERAPDVGLHVDVKCGRHAARVAEALRSFGLVDRAFASSSSLRTLALLRAAAPELRRGLGYPDDRLGLARRRPFQPLVPGVVGALGRVLPYRLPRWLGRVDAAVAILHFAVLSPTVVETCRRKDAAIFVWTINERSLLERAVALGVDGVITDDPRIFGG